MASQRIGEVMKTIDRAPVEIDEDVACLETGLVSRSPFPDVVETNSLAFVTEVGHRAEVGTVAASSAMAALRLRGFHERRALG